MDHQQGRKFPPISKMSDEEIRRFGMDTLIRLLRDIDADRLAGLKEHGNLMKTMNQHMQTHLMEVRSLKEVNKRLQDENQEVRDLACFLDDDRQKGRKLAREWQRFGRYTSGVMKGELTSYQDKLRELEDKQEQMMRENVELKELCLYLDEELKRYRGETIDRDDGDGSSSSSPIGEKIPDDANYADNRQPSALNEQTLQYIRQLEHQVQQIDHNKQPVQRGGPAGSRPASVGAAMRVLEIHERLERPHHHHPSASASASAAAAAASMDTDDMELDEAEKAIVRQMCNVVWKKLGET